MLNALIKWGTSTEITQKEREKKPKPEGCWEWSSKVRERALGRLAGGLFIPCQIPKVSSHVVTVWVILRCSKSSVWKYEFAGSKDQWCTSHWSLDLGSKGTRFWFIVHHLWTRGLDTLGAVWLHVQQGSKPGGWYMFIMSHTDYLQALESYRR